MIFYQLFFVFVVFSVAYSQYASYYLNNNANNTCRIISVSGSGASNGIPDTAVVTIGVSDRGNTSIVPLDK